MKKLFSVIISLALLGGIVSCGGSADTSNDSKKPDANANSNNSEEEKKPDAANDTSGKTAKIALVIKNAGNPYNEKEADGFKKAVEESGAEFILRQPEKATAELQITAIEELIAQDVDVIAIVGNDVDALQPVLTVAMNKGIKVLSLDSGVNPDSRMVHVNQAGIQIIGETLVKAVSDIAGGSGDFAILSATSQASNQNAWIEAMKVELAKDNNKELNLVEVAYGDDEQQKSFDQTQALLKNYPNLKVICAPTTVGIMAAGKALKDQGVTASIKLTGLGLPSEMAEYIGDTDEFSCPYMFLWNPIDIGRLGGYTAIALLEDKITGQAGDTYVAGDLGEYTVVEAADGGTEVILGPPFKFDPSNIEEWKTVY